MDLQYDKAKNMVFFLHPQYRVNWDSIGDVQRVIKLWANKNFPRRTSHQALCKLVLEEIPEFLQEQDSAEEYADLLILIFDIASLRGIDIAEALEAKMKINIQRKWSIDPNTGIAKHI